MKFEFGDLYKFIVSAGIALAGGALLFLWLLLKEPFDLTLKEVDIKALSPSAQETVRQRQEVVAALVKVVPWLAPIFVAGGLGIAGWGVHRWRKLQSISDQLADLDLQIKQASVRPKTEDEATAAELVEQSELVAAGIASTAPEVRAGYASSLAHAVERALVAQLKRLLPRYTVQEGMMVGDAEVDLVLRGQSMFDKDYLVNVKAIRNGFNADWLRQAALNLRSAALLYQQLVNRIPNTCLLVAVDDAAWDKRDYAKLREQVVSEMPHRSAKHRVVVMRVSDLEGLTAEKARFEMGLPV